MASLTVKYLESLERRLRAGEKVKEWHPDGDGLYLRVLHPAECRSNFAAGRLSHSRSVPPQWACRTPAMRRARL